MDKRIIRKRIEWLFGLITPKKIIRAQVSYLSPSKTLSGKKIIITGGSRGIGYAMAKKFISEGADVLITGRDEVALKEVSQSLSCQYIMFDNSNITDIPHFIRVADKMLNGANVLVNNAGISLHESDIRQVSYKNFDDQFNINLRGGYFLCKEFLQLLDERKDKDDCNILFVSSERGKYVDDIPYGLTKAAINSLVQGLAYNNRKRGIRVNAIAPGVTATQLTNRSEDNLFAGNYSTGRWYLADEMAEVASFLISDIARCISGQIIYCDNGNSINSYRK